VGGLTAGKIEQCQGTGLADYWRCVTTKHNNGSYTTLAKHLFMIIFIREENGKCGKSLLNGRKIG
jgi:hypothetical protein